MGTVEISEGSVRIHPMYKAGIAAEVFFSGFFCHCLEPGARVNHNLPVPAFF